MHNSSLFLRTDVHVNLYLLSINELNEGTEVLKSTGYLWLLWHDDFLEWDPSHYGGIEYYLWPQVSFLYFEFVRFFFLLSLDHVSSNNSTSVVDIDICMKTSEQRLPENGIKKAKRHIWPPSMIQLIHVDLREIVLRNA